MFRRISYLTAGLVVAGVVYFSDEIKSMLASTPLGSIFNK